MVAQRARHRPAVVIGDRVARWMRCEWASMTGERVDKALRRGLVLSALVAACGDGATAQPVDGGRSVRDATGGVCDRLEHAAGGEWMRLLHRDVLALNGPVDACSPDGAALVVASP